MLGPTPSSKATTSSRWTREVRMTKNESRVTSSSGPGPRGFGDVLSWNARPPQHGLRRQNAAFPSRLATVTALERVGCLRVSLVRRKRGHVPALHKKACECSDGATRLRAVPQRRAGVPPAQAAKRPHRCASRDGGTLGSRAGLPYIRTGRFMAPMRVPEVSAADSLADSACQHSDDSGTSKGP
jgi:hypothetical protein